MTDRLGSIEQRRADLARLGAERAKAYARFRWILVLVWRATLLGCALLCWRRSHDRH